MAMHLVLLFQKNTSRLGNIFWFNVKIFISLVKKSQYTIFEGIVVIIKLVYIISSTSDGSPTLTK